MRKKEISNVKGKSVIALLLCLPVGLLAFYSSYKYGECIKNNELELAEKHKGKVFGLFKLSIVFALIFFVYFIVKITTK